MDHFENKFFIAVLLMTLCFVVCRGIVTCKAGAFLEGLSASVLCDFGKDVNATKNNFNVMRYADFRSSTESYILLCNWLDNGDMQCTVEEGYNFNYKVGMGLELQIPEVKKSMAGTYVCHLVPSENIPVSPCNLTLTSGYTLRTTSLMTKQAVPDCDSSDFQEIYQDTKKDSGTSSEMIALIIVLVLLLPALVSLAGAIIYLWYNYGLVSRRHQSSTSSEDGWEELCWCTLFTRLMSLIHVNPPSPVGLEAGHTASETTTFRKQAKYAPVAAEKFKEEPFDRAQKQRKKNIRQSAINDNVHENDERLPLKTNLPEFDNTELKPNDHEEMTGNLEPARKCEESKAFQTKTDSASTHHTVTIESGEDPFQCEYRAENEIKGRSASLNYKRENDREQLTSIPATDDLANRLSPYSSDNEEDEMTQDKEPNDKTHRCLQQLEPNERSKMVENDKDGFNNNTDAKPIQHESSSILCEQPKLQIVHLNRTQESENRSSESNAPMTEQISLVRTSEIKETDALHEKGAANLCQQSQTKPHQALVKKDTLTDPPKGIQDAMSEQSGTSKCFIL